MTTNMTDADQAHDDLAKTINAIVEPHLAAYEDGDIEPPQLAHLVAGDAYIKGQEDLHLLMDELDDARTKLAEWHSMGTFAYMISSMRSKAAHWRDMADNALYDDAKRTICVGMAERLTDLADEFETVSAEYGEAVGKL